MMFVSLSLGAVLAVSLIVLVSILTGGGNSGLFSSNVLDGHVVSSFTLPGLNGGQQRAPWASGYPTVVVWYASWCTPCKEELPRVATYERTHELGTVRFYGVDYNDATSAGRSFARHAGVRFASGVDAHGDVTTSPFNLGGLPDTAFINSDGTVRYFVYGPVTNAQLAAGITALR
jgi:thiol-disulfide isomerase/thioredoxin